MSTVLRIAPRGPHAVGTPSRADEEREGLLLEAAVDRLFEEHLRETASADTCAVQSNGDAASIELRINAAKRVLR